MFRGDSRNGQHTIRNEEFTIPEIAVARCPTTTAGNAQSQHLVQFVNVAPE